MDGIFFRVAEAVRILDRRSGRGAALDYRSAQTSPAPFWNGIAGCQTIFRDDIAILDGCACWSPADESNLVLGPLFSQLRLSLVISGVADLGGQCKYDTKCLPAYRTPEATFCPRQVWCAIGPAGSTDAGPPEESMIIHFLLAPAERSASTEPIALLKERQQRLCAAVEAATWGPGHCGSGDSGRSHLTGAAASVRLQRSADMTLPGNQEVLETEGRCVKIAG